MLARFEFKGELGPEDVICAHFAGQLVQAENDGLTRCVFHHVPNEGKRSPAEGARLKHMGMLPGFGDFVILMAWGSGIIEFKVPDEARKRQQRLSASQMVIAFLPEEAEAFKALLDRIEKSKKAAFLAASLADFGAMFDAVVAVKDATGVHNTAVAIRTMAQLAVERLEEMGDDGEG